MTTLCKRSTSRWYRVAANRQQQHRRRRSSEAEGLSFFQVPSMTSEYFHVRKLIWDEMEQFVKPSEVEELRTAIGNQLIDENQVRPVPTQTSVQHCSSLKELLADV